MNSSPQPPPPSPWTPAGSPDPTRESKLLVQMRSAIRQLINSQFLRRFLARLRHPHIQQGLDNLLAFSPHIEIVTYGIGSIESHKASRLQLALVLLLKRSLGARVAEPIQVFDPVLSSVECNVAAALGCRILAVNECARREAVAPTIFYMPRCHLGLYDNLLNANWKPGRLRRMVVLGNSFGMHVRMMRRGFAGSEDLEVDGRHLVWIRKYVREVEMEERENFRCGFRVYEDELDNSLKGFNGVTRWHFFEVNDDADMGFF